MGRVILFGAKIISGFFFFFFFVKMLFSCGFCLPYPFGVDCVVWWLVLTILCSIWMYRTVLWAKCGDLRYVTRNIQYSVFGVWCVKHSVPRYHCTNRMVLQFYSTNFNLHVHPLSLWNIDGIDIVCKGHGRRQYLTWDSTIEAPTLSQTMMKSNYDRHTMARTWNYNLLTLLSVFLFLACDHQFDVLRYFWSEP